MDCTSSVLFIGLSKLLALSTMLVLEGMDSGLHNEKIGQLGCLLHGQYKQCAVHWLIKTVLFIGLSKLLALSIRQHLSC